MTVAIAAARKRSAAAQHRAQSREDAASKCAPRRVGRRRAKRSPKWNAATAKRSRRCGPRPGARSRRYWRTVGVERANVIQLPALPTVRCLRFDAIDTAGRVRRCHRAHAVALLALTCELPNARSRRPRNANEGGTWTRLWNRSAAHDGTDPERRSCSARRSPKRVPRPTRRSSRARARVARAALVEPRVLCRRRHQQRACGHDRRAPISADPEVGSRAVWGPPTAEPVGTAHRRDVRRSSRTRWRASAP